MRALYQMLLPLPLRIRLHQAWDRANEKYLRLRMFGKYESLIPPLELMHDGPVGYREFKENAEEFFGYYTGFCGLKPHERMLDIGSGIGRKTFLLTRYLNSDGSYEGLDIVKTGVDWCTTRITAKYPRFKFKLTDVYNQHYNPTGRCKASEYTFPFPDESFDFVMLGSVFTHMLSEEMEHYLSEIVRVLKPGGRLLITFFLLNDESLGFIEEGRSTVDLREQFGPARAVSRENPEWAVGYDIDFVTSIYEKNGLTISQPIHFGSWCGRSDYLGYQDIVVAVKPGAASR